MANTVDDIRTALQNGQVVLDNGVFRIASDRPGGAPLVKSQVATSGPSEASPEGTADPEIRLKPTTWGAR